MLSLGGREEQGLSLGLDLFHNNFGKSSVSKL